MSCQVDGTDREPTAWKWKYSNKDYTADDATAGVVMATTSYKDSSQGNQLTLTKQTTDNEVECKVTVDGYEYTQAVKVDFVEVEVTSTTVMEKDAATLTCKLTNAQAAPTDIYWMKGSEKFEASVTKAGSKVTNSAFKDGAQTSELKIDSPTADSTYTCAIKYTHNTISTEATIDVYKLVITQPTKHILEGQAGTFTCTLSGSKTAPSYIKWELDDEEIATNDGNYTITSTSYKSEGMTSTIVIKEVTEDMDLACQTKVSELHLYLEPINTIIS